MSLIFSRYIDLSISSFYLMLLQNFPSFEIIRADDFFFLIRISIGAGFDDCLDMKISISF